MASWEEIHGDFAKKEYSWSNKTYQQYWEEHGLTYQDAREWIPIGFKLEDYREVKEWKEQEFTSQEAKLWREVDLTPNDYNFISQLKQSSCTPEQYSNYKNKNSQALLNHLYPNKNQVKEINLDHYLNSNQPNELIIADYPELKEINGYEVSNLTKITINNCPQLEGIDINWFKNLQQLILNNLPNLKKLNCSNNKLTTLEINSCDNLQWIDCSNNHLTEIKLPLGEKLAELSLSNNNLHQDLSFLKDLVGLEQLYLYNNPFYGSLEYLQKMSKLEGLWINDVDIDSGLEYLPERVKEFSCSSKERKNAKCKTILNLFINNRAAIEYGKVINFSQKLQEVKQQIKQWKELGFTSEKAWLWINADAKVDDYKFVAWFRDTKKLGPEWITNYQEDYQVLSERFKKYGLCIECKELNTGEQWCKDCNNPRLQKNFTKWTSHNPQIDQFLQKYQLAATDADKFIEWIPYEQFTKIEYLAEGGFGKVYRAEWATGNIHHWDTENKRWQRKKDYCYKDKDGKEYNHHRAVVLKSLTNSESNTNFLNETAKHKDIDDWFNNIVPCYGLSQDPNTGNYLMVMQYMPEGNLRHYLRNKSKELTLQNKLNQLFHIAQGLKDIHQKNLVHRDFHSGNILKGIEKTSCLITDLGLCKPVNETSQEDKIFGVIPYVAPEVLQGQPYTQAADIYSFGIITYEILSGLPPYYDRNHDQYLGMEICQGLRPQLKIKIPSLLEDLINQCWDTDPTKRPTAQELEKTLRSWKQEINGREDTKFKNQFQEAEELNKTLPDGIKFPDYKKKMHAGASYHSKLLPTKEITKLLQNFNFQTKTSELNTQLIKIQKLAKEANESNAEQKYNDLKKTLNLILEKSEELEKMITTNQLIISEEMKTKLIEIKNWKTKLNELQKEDNAWQALKKTKSQKEKELEELKNTITAKNYLEEDELEDILEAQEDFLKNNNFKRLERARKRLIKTISEKEIDDLCQKQAEITSLVIQLNQLQQTTTQKTKQLTRIIREKNTQIAELEEKLEKPESYPWSISESQNKRKSKDDSNFERESKRLKNESNQTKKLNTGLTEKVRNWSIGETQNNWTNLHPNFTPQLIQTWQNHHFTYQQARDWINIHSPTDQIQAIQEPEFYAWLRDIKQVDSDWVIDHGNYQALKQKYQTYQQQNQLTAQTLHQPLGIPGSSKGGNQ